MLPFREGAYKSPGFGLYTFLKNELASGETNGHKDRNFMHAGHGNKFAQSNNY